MQTQATVKITTTTNIYCMLHIVAHVQVATAGARGSHKWAIGQRTERCMWNRFFGGVAGAGAGADGKQLQLGM